MLRYPSAGMSDGPPPPHPDDHQDDARLRLRGVHQNTQIGLCDGRTPTVSIALSLQPLDPNQPGCANSTAGPLPPMANCTHCGGGPPAGTSRRSPTRSGASSARRRSTGPSLRQLRKQHRPVQRPTVASSSRRRSPHRLEIVQRLRDARPQAEPEPRAARRSSRALQR